MFERARIALAKLQRFPMGTKVYIDGDAAAYALAFGAGDPGTVRMRARNWLSRMARDLDGADPIVVTTPALSVKGYRYAIASRAPYQGNRKGKAVPPMLGAAQDYLNNLGDHSRVSSGTEEADDTIAELQHMDPGIVLSPDKDLRMLPGWAAVWRDRKSRVRVDAFHVERFGKVYGRAWFWRQMLHGDTADNIKPVCPRFGEAAAEQLLAGVESDEEAASIVLAVFEEHHPGRGMVTMLEQACLLWLHRTPDHFDCLRPGGPLHCLQDAMIWLGATEEIQRRVDLWNTAD